MNITETPDKWVILKINLDDKIYYKVYATWAGGYLGADSWKLNSGITEIKTDEDDYYFIGFSGSVYKCKKTSYGVITSYGNEILNQILEKGEGKITLLEDRDNWTDLKI